MKNNNFWFNKNKPFSWTRLRQGMSYAVASLFVTINISACSGTCLEQQSKDTTKFSFTMSAPSQYPAGISTKLPVVVTNTSKKAVNNVTYSIVNNNTGGTITVDPDSAKSCAQLLVEQSCTLQVQLSSSTKPGTFSISATNTDTQSLAKKIFSNNDTQTLDVIVGLTTLPPSNNESGINGITFYNPNVISLPDDNAGIAIITAVVNSANAGLFNEIALLTNNSDTPIQYTVLTGNSGQNMTTLTNGSIVTLAVKIPAGATQITFTPSLKYNGTSLSKADSPITIPVLRPNSTKIGVLNMRPSNFYLNESMPKQVITVINVGNSNATALVPTLSTQAVTINTADSTCGNSLPAGASCNYVVQFDANSDKAGTGSLSTNYNNGTELSTSIANFTYKGLHSLANLNISSTQNPNFLFRTTTISSSESAIVTLTNNGSLDIESLNYGNLPNVFNISNSGVNNPCMIGQTLQPTQSCNLVLNYSNATVTPPMTFNLVMNYQYSDPLIHQKKSGNSSVTVSYITLPSIAVLSFSTQSTNFGNILNNNYESAERTITINNIGEIATSPQLLIINNLSHIYSLGTTDCSSIPAGGSCTAVVKSGPIPSSISAGTQNANLQVTYEPAPNEQMITISSQLTTSVVTAASAIITVQKESATGFLGGNGESTGSPYALYPNNNGTITYIITNTGTVPANNFAINHVTSEFYLFNSDCGSTLAANGGTCHATVTVRAPSSVTSFTITPSAFTMSWVDQDSPLGQTQPLLNNLIYVSTVLPPTIGMSPNIIYISGGMQSQNVTLSLSGGYNVPNQLITLTDNSGGMLAPITPNTCTLSSVNPVCTITLTSADVNLINGNYSVGVSNSGTVSVPPTIGVIVNIQWTSLGNPNFVTNAQSDAIVLDPQYSIPYVGFSDINNSSRATVMGYFDGSWIKLGVGSPGLATYIAMAIDTSIVMPYVAYSDGVNGNKASVFKANTDPNDKYIMQVCNPDFSDGAARNLAIAIPTNNGPVNVAYIDDAHGGKLTVMSCLDGSTPPNSWQNVGPVGFTPSTAGAPSIAFQYGIQIGENKPYVAYEDGSNGGRATVMMYNGTSWVNVGNPGFSDGVIDNISLAFNPATDEPYVAFSDRSDNSYRISVMRYDGTNWVYVGSQMFSPGVSLNVTLAFNPVTNIPYVTFIDVANGSGVTTMKFNGNSWIFVGSTNFSNGAAASAKLAFAPSDNYPYVVFSSIADNYGLNVMYFSQY